MTQAEFKERTKAVAVRVIRLVDGLSPSLSTNAIARQLVRSATSIGANYRAACRTKSRTDFISKMGIVEEETDETLYWLELLGVSGKMATPRLRPLMEEVEEILAMTVSSVNTARSRRQSAIRNPQSAIR